MRMGLGGLALAFALALPASMQPLHASEHEVLRFVPNAAFLRNIDPAALSRLRPTTPPEMARPAPASSVSPPRAAARPVPTPTRPDTTAAKSWPVTLTEVRERAKAEASGQRDEWSAAEVRDAQARCRAILKRIDAVATLEEPLKDGECGTPAPIRLVSIGRKPEVVISPPALVNCDMAEALHTWLKRDLQPLARKHLGGPIIKIAKMSDYSCRNAYGRARGRLSEHARANALDIAGFTTAKGEDTMLLADWGMTARDIRRQVAAAKARAGAEEKRHLAADERARAAARAPERSATRNSMTAAAPGTRREDEPAEPGTPPPSALGLASGAPAGGVARTSIIDGIPRLTVSIPGASADSERDGLDTSSMSRLGGPKPHAITTGSIVQRTAARDGGAVAEFRKQRFLRGAHEAACRIFGTVLGPEANNAHRNHFHVDMAERGSGAFCQ